MQDYLKPILAFDSAMGGCSAAVLDPATGKVVSDIRLMARGQSEILVPMIGEVIAESGFGFADLGLIVTTVGPGAFTGLRIGISTARSFGLALGIPVTGVMTTEAIARAITQNQNRNKKILVVLETKREDFYVHLFDETGHSVSGPGTALGEVIAERYGSGPMLACGDGLARLSETITLPDSWETIEGYELPDPEVMAVMGLKQIRSGILTAPDPVYLRDADVSQSNRVMRTIAPE